MLNFRSFYENPLWLVWGQREVLISCGGGIWFDWSGTKYKSSFITGEADTQWQMTLMLQRKIQYLFQIFAALARIQICGLWYPVVLSSVYIKAWLWQPNRNYISQGGNWSHREINFKQTAHPLPGAKIPKREYLLVTCEFVFLDLWLQKSCQVNWDACNWILTLGEFSAKSEKVVSSNNR